MKEIASFAPLSADACTGNCQGCGKTHIKIFGQHDPQSRLLSARVQDALANTAIDGKVLEISEPGLLQANGVRVLPALMVEGEIVLQGMVPSVPEIESLLRNKDLFRSKLYRLRNIGVPVDMSEVSANALIFAWKLAQKLDCNLEVVYAMDSIFEGSTPSATGFLAGYSHTMQTELDGFITETLGEIGVSYEPPARFAGAPGKAVEAPRIASKVVYGAPDTALSEYSRQSDLLVMGATGRGGLVKKLFGSVSAELSKIAHCPVMFVPREAEFKDFADILYASDFDSLQPMAVRQAASFANRFDGQIHFVHVGPGAERNMEAQREKFQASFGESVSDKPFIFTKMVSDDIADALYEYAFYHRIALMVFVTHHRDFWDNILHKSVTNEVIATSTLPILVIHSDDDML